MLGLLVSCISLGADLALRWRESFPADGGKEELHFPQVDSWFAAEQRNFCFYRGKKVQSYSDLDSWHLGGFSFNYFWDY